MDDGLEDGSDLGFIMSYNYYEGIDETLSIDDDTNIIDQYENPLEGQPNSAPGMDTDEYFNDGPTQANQPYDGGQGTTMDMNQGQDASMNGQLQGVNGQVRMQVDIADINISGMNEPLDPAGVEGAHVQSPAQEMPTSADMGNVEVSPLDREKSKDWLMMDRWPSGNRKPIVDSVPPRNLIFVQSIVESVVSRSWQRGERSIKFVADARAAFAEISLKNESTDQELDRQLEEIVIKCMITKSVNPSAKGVLTTASAGAPSARMMSYIRCSVAERLISQRTALKALLNAGTGETVTFSDRARRAFASLCAEILPWYDITGKTSFERQAECVDILATVTMLLQMSAQTQFFVRETIVSLSCDRVVALARCAGRRVPQSWNSVEEAMRAVENSPAANTPLLATIAKFRDGLYSSFENPEYARLSEGRFSVGSILDWQTAARIASPVLGQAVVSHLMTLWSKREADNGDCQVLLELERTADRLSESGTTIQEKTRMCEMLVHNVAKAASADTASSWRNEWGGMRRLLRMIQDALPQAKPHLSSEVSSLIVACGVVGCCAVVFGIGNERNLNVDDATECSVGLRGFAIAYLEEVVFAEDSVEWKPFGVWLLLLASRCGNLLKGPIGTSDAETGMDHVRASKALRDWSLFGGSGVSAAPSSAKLGQDSIGSMAMELAMRVIDVADESGSDETLIELCSDLVV